MGVLECRCGVVVDLGFVKVSTIDRHQQSDRCEVLPEVLAIDYLDDDCLAIAPLGDLYCIGLLVKGTTGCHLRLKLEGRQVGLRIDARE